MIATLLSLALLAYGHDDMTAQQYLSFSVTGSPTVRIGSTNGSINLKTGGSGVSVTATKKADSQAKLEALKVTSTQSGGTITVTAVFPSSCNDCGSIAFDVTVPAGTKVELSTTNGSITASGLSADSQMSTTNGSVRAGYTSAAGVRAISLQTTNGSVTLGLPTNAKIGRVKGSTVHGSISSAWPLNVTRVDYAGANVDQTLQAGGATLNLSTENGSISISKN